MSAYGLLGEKLGHSFSPQIHAMLGNHDYKLFPTDKDDLEYFIRNGKWLGLNVTIPYKVAVLPFVDELSATAKRMGCVNTLIRRNGKIYGHNSDYFGFKYMLDSSKIRVEQKKCLILGSGGAAKTVQYVLEDLNAKEIINISRKGKNNYSNIDKHYNADIIVNATPVGMYPNNGECPIELKNFKQCSGVLDLIYNPLKTRLIFDAQMLSIPNCSGLIMLAAQAKESAEMFMRTKFNNKQIDRISSSIAARCSNIVLIGMPGCGKSTVGYRLALKLGRKLIDTDKQIRKKYKKTAAEIIVEDGEKAFRRKESTAAFEAGKSNNAVIATGGGIVTVEDNYYALAQNGIIVFIDRDINKLAKKGRPLSKNGNEELYKKRLSLYRKFADITIDGNQKIEAEAEQIINEFNAIYGG